MWLWLRWYILGTLSTRLLDATFVSCHMKFSWTSWSRSGIFPREISQISLHCMGIRLYNVASILRETDYSKTYSLLLLWGLQDLICQRIKAERNKENIRTIRDCVIIYFRSRANETLTSRKTYIWPERIKRFRSHLIVNRRLRCSLKPLSFGRLRDLVCMCRSGHDS